MAIDMRFFHSKVTRRIFALFFISALLPLAVLTALSLYQLDRQFGENASIELRRETKNAGMLLLERLLQLESELELVGRYMADHGTVRPSSADLRDLVPGFSRLTLYPRSGQALALVGQAIDLPGDRAHRPTGASRLLLPGETTGSGTRAVLLIHRVAASDQLLVGQIRPEVLWAFELNAATEVWVLDSDGRLLYTNVDPSSPLPRPGLLTNSASGTFAWRANGMDRQVGYWSIFLDYRFEVGSWTLLLGEPSARTFAQATSFYRIFLPTLMLALLLVTLLSLIQIRRFLVPVEVLTQATRQIAERRFDSRVQVVSGDEFEELGHAFNRMAGQLDRQFHALGIMSTLDRAILAAMEGEQVVRILFIAMKEIVDYDFLAIGLVDEAERRGLLLLIDAPDAGGMREVDVHLGQVEREVFRDDAGQGIGLARAQLPSFVAPYVGPRSRHFLAFPVHQGKEPVAIIYLGFEDQTTLLDSAGIDLRDLFNRATLAYANADWKLRLYRQTHFDTLTGLTNRLVLRDRLDLALERSARHGLQGALMFVDLDDFKLVNDTLGHAIGDQMLIQASSLLKAHLRQEDTLARLGGDEFAFLLPDLQEPESADRIAARLVAALSTTLRIDGNSIDLSASIGIALFPGDSRSADELLKFADMALYQAKTAGKNQFQFFSPAYQEAMLARNVLLGDMRRALEAGEFRLHFQPKVTLPGRTLAGAEALIRWQHPERGLLSPAVFLPAAEASELIVPLGEWVIRAACEQVRQWQTCGLAAPRIAVNISARQFARSNLVAVTEDALANAGIEPTSLEFEVTESVALDDVEAVIMTLRALRKLGVRLAIDDFGTGYSALSYLRQLPIDSLKIDQSFVRGLPDDRESVSIARTIIALAHGLDMTVVAEGVETEPQAVLLQDLGCDAIQGYLVSRPLPAADFASRFVESG